METQKMVLTGDREKHSLLCSLRVKRDVSKLCVGIGLWLQHRETLNGRKARKMAHGLANDSSKLLSKKLASPIYRKIL